MLLRLLIVGPILLSSALLIQGCDDSGTNRPPNVLIISLDTLRADHVGSYGYDRETTPFLDRLAEGGTRFERAFVNTHGTPPSHATLLTGLYQESHRVSYPGADGAADHRVAEELVTLAESFGAAGYRTVAYTGAGWMSASYGFDQGFDTFVEKQRPVPAAVRAFVGRWQELLETGDEPIFALFHTYEIHSPYGAPPPWKGMFSGAAPEAGESTFRPTTENLVRFANRARQLEERDLAALTALYDEGIRFTDHALETLFRELETLGGLDHTIVIVTADHGEEFGDHGGLLHGRSLYQELVHVPLIVTGPELPQGVVSSMPVSLVDIAPTLLRLTGVQHDVPLPGRSLFDAARRDTDRVFFQYLDDLSGVVSGPWKLIRTSLPGEEVSRELYDLEHDPREIDDRSQARPEIVAELERAISEWKQSCVELDLPSRRESAQADEAKTEELRALGYVD